MSPRSDDPVISGYDAEFIQDQRNLKGSSHSDNNTEADSDAGLPPVDVVDLGEGKSANKSGWLDMDFMACCGLGNKGACVHCGQLVLNSQAFVHDETMPERVIHSECDTIRNDKATAIQSVARGNKDRDHVVAIKAEKARKEKEARLRELARRAKVEAQAAEAERLRLLEAERMDEVSLGEDANVVKKEKKSFFGNIFGCKGKKSTTDAVVETTVEDL